MKFGDLFKSRRNIRVTVLLIVLLLVAGGIWQYRNFVNDRIAQLEKQNLGDELDEGLNAQVNLDTGLEVIDKDGSENEEKLPITEVSKTDSTTVKDVEKLKDQKNKVSAKNDTKTTAKLQTDKMETMVLPVFGTLNGDFSISTLVYSKTLEMWTTHPGIDLKAEEGSQVRASMDGVVVEAKNDAQWGMTIIIDHGSGIQTKYSNLSTLDLVSVGQRIKKGDVISGVGRTALCEIADEPHLHFEVLKDGKNIDPKMYLPKQTTKR
ncbi:MAG: peptidoglycan DD-metalloendopeptidase family protein [Bacillota bacterium]